MNHRFVSAMAVGTTAAFAFASNSIAADLYTGYPDYTAPTVHSSGLIFGGIGDLSGSYRWVDTEDDGGQDAALVSGDARVSIPFGGAFSLQLDADGEYNFTDEGSGDEEENPQGFWLVGAHASIRNPDTGLIGIFGAAGQGYNTGCCNDGGEEKVGYMVGGEGQVYLGDLTLYAQGGYANFEQDREGGAAEGFIDGWFARGVGRWFVGADTLIEGEVSYAYTGSYFDEGDSQDNGEFWNWGVKAKTRLGGSMPIYGVLGYRGGTYYADDDDDRLTEHVVYGGITVLMGADNLRDNDRRAATLDMPLIPLRAAAIMEGLD
jgi:hypothetical protein